MNNPELEAILKMLELQEPSTPVVIRTDVEHSALASRLKEALVSQGTQNVSIVTEIPPPESI